MYQAAIQILKANKYRITRQRMAMLKYLFDHQHHYIPVTQIDDHLHQLFPGMSHNTIYRNVKDFAKMGIVETREEPSGVWVKYQCDFGHLHHHHFICRKCGKVVEVEMCPLDFFTRQLPGYTIETHDIELTGLCADCHRAAEAKQA